MAFRYDERGDEERTKRVIMMCIQKLKYSEIKARAAESKVVKVFVSGRDVFAIFLTGYGKTLCYACLLLVFDELVKRNAPSTILVIAPIYV